MAALTKTQINYFRERIDAVSRKIISAMCDEVPFMLPEFNVAEERVKAIASGAVELDMDAVRKKLVDSSSYGPRLFEVFPDTVAVCEYLTRKKDLDRLLRKRHWERAEGVWVDAVQKHMCLVLDDFVLGNIQVEEVPQFLKDLESWRPSGYWPLVRIAPSADNINS